MRIRPGSRKFQFKSSICLSRISAGFLRHHLRAIHLPYTQPSPAQGTVELLKHTLSILVSDVGPH